MTTTRGSKRVVVVAGDVTMDWNLARIRSSKSSIIAWNSQDRTCAYPQRGGAALLAALIGAVAKKLQGTHEVRSAEAPQARVAPDDSAYHHSYAIWTPMRSDKRSGGRVWRVEEFLGLHRASQMQADTGSTAVLDDAPDAEIVVLDDADLGFRDHPRHWPQAITTEGRRPLILLKMARPVAHGQLWSYLHDHHAQRLVVVMTVNDLRLTEVQVSRELSWERTAEDLAWEMMYNAHLRALSDCAHVIVSFDTAGAFLMSRSADGSAPKSRLFFDPQVIEGTWAQNYPGGMIGYTSCLAASVARQLMLDGDIVQAIQSGLSAMRTLHQIGYGSRVGANQPEDRESLAFPVDAIVEEISKVEKPFAEAEVRDPARFIRNADANDAKAGKAGFWTILQDSCAKSLGPAKTLYDLAEETVLRGTSAALAGVPLGQFGNLLTVDRREIESYRSIRGLVSEYYRQENQERPLSIAVFGAPGSGKSFGITEVAKSVLPDRIKKLTFNLSQFSDPVELLGALHQVRDVALTGQIPLVFWDEFDTTLDERPLGWLRYFLSPMQDGSFQEGQITHPIGRAIFVFAGGTSETRENFGKKLDPADFEMAKGPDFISRLKGYVNIMGPNPAAGDPEADPYFIIRRAVLLRSFLERAAVQIFRPPERSGAVNTDSGVLRALLKIHHYKHGARSMESVIAMSLLTGKTRFERSCLPSEDQLNLHVNGRAFLALVQQIVLNDQVLEQLAEAAHKVYVEGLRSRGEKALYVDTDYINLPEHEKEQNRGNVRDIANKVERAGYVMVPARSNEPPFDFPGSDLETLAEMEHERWMTSKITGGWRYGVETDRARQLHKDLLPWKEMSEEERRQRYSPGERDAIGTTVLPDTEKEKDRDLIRGIPRILAEGGYTIIKVVDN